jgi:predicted methyltransferase
MSYKGPLLTRATWDLLHAALGAGEIELQCSLDLGRSLDAVQVDADAWTWRGTRYPWCAPCRERTVQHWTGTSFEAVARFGESLFKLVPTEWGPPTFEIDGVKMLPTAQVSPYEDARAKVALVEPAGKRVLDTCGGLGYFASWCLQGGAREVHSWERSADVLWLRDHNPWSPGDDPRLTLRPGDVGREIGLLPDGSFEAVLHDPPRFALAGELYSQAFYDQLARVLVPGGRLFHYVGRPNRLTSGRDVPAEVTRRLQRAGFRTRPALDGVFATRGRRSPNAPFRT